MAKNSVTNRNTIRRDTKIQSILKYHIRLGLMSIYVLLLYDISLHIEAKSEGNITIPSEQGSFRI
jgi:hypothetical protein